MSDLHEKGFTGQAGVERVGDTIHRERLTRNIQVETIARDLKLNADYIRGIEESNYTKLPAIAYCRVYIKSIAKYLGLDGEALLERFAHEMNIESPDPERERRDTLSVKVQGTKQPNPFLPLLYILIALVLIALLLKNGNREGAETPEVGSADSTKIVIPADTGELGDEQLPKGVSAIVDSGADSTKAPLPASEGGTVTDSAKATVKKDSVSNAKQEKKTDDLKTDDKSVKKKLSFEIEGKNDSSYVKIFADGKKVYDGTVRNGKGLSFGANDSLNVMIGKNNGVRYKLNGTVLGIKGSGSKILKLSGEKIELWQTKKWNSTFSGR